MREARKLEPGGAETMIDASMSAKIDVTGKAALNRRSAIVHRVMLALAAAIATTALASSACHKQGPMASSRVEVLVTDVVDWDVPIYSEWVGSMVVA